MSIEFPKQTENDMAAGVRLADALAARQLLVEADGALMIIPFDSIKYLTAYPAPGGLPAHAIKAASISG